MTDTSATLRPLGEYRAYLFDVDGTLVYPRQAIPGAREALVALKQAGKPIRIVTNNSLLSRGEMAARLRGFGFPIEDQDVATAVVATSAFIQQEHPRARVHVLGSRGLRDELSRTGLTVIEDDPAVDYLVIGCDVDVSYERLTRAMRVANAGARIVAVNQDQVIPDAQGGFPGSALFVGAIKGATGRDPDVVIGKPSTRLLEEVLIDLGLPAAECLFVGDSLATDAPVARAVGMPLLLVLTGVTDRALLASAAFQPEYLLDGVADLIPVLDGTPRRESAALSETTASATGRRTHDERSAR